MGSLRSAFVALSVLLAASVILADEKKEQDQKSPSSSPSGGDFEFSAGMGFVSSPRPYIGASSRSFPVPVLGMKYKGWFLEGIRGGYSFLEGKSFDARAFAQVRFLGLEPESSPFLEGMDPRRRSLDAGLEMVYRGRPVGFRVAALTDVLGRSNGQEVSAQAITGAPLGKVLLLAGFGPRWLSQDRVDFYYGVKPTEATPGRPAYFGRSTINWDVSLSAIYKPTPRWTVFTLLTREGLGSAIRDSPLVERTSAYSLVASVTFGF